jgi:hypothetical protein
MKGELHAFMEDVSTVHELYLIYKREKCELGRERCECGRSVDGCIGHTHQRHTIGGGRNVWEERWAYVPLKEIF